MIFMSSYDTVFICPTYVDFHESLLYGFYLSYLCWFSWVLTIWFYLSYLCWFSWVLTIWFLSVLPMLIFMSPYYMVFICPTYVDFNESLLYGFICPTYVDFNESLLYGFHLSFLSWFSWVPTIWFLSVLPMLILMSLYYMVFNCLTYVIFIRL